jgi:hypothetical protein
MAYQHLRKINRDKVNIFFVMNCTAVPQNKLRKWHYVFSVNIHQHCSHKVICPLTAVATRECHLDENGSALQLCSHGSSVL